MKNYITPELEVIRAENDDIITTSEGVKTPIIDENDGVWDLDL